MASPSSSSTSSSSGSSPIHPASLIDRSCHSPALLDLVEVKVSQEVFDYTVDRVIETVDFAMRRSSASSSRGRAFNPRKVEHVKFAKFVEDVLTRAEVTMPTLLATLVYIDRARPQLHIGLEQWALERVFLGALIVASKYLNDSTLKNVHWAMCTGVFGKRDVGRIEREYLDVLDFKLNILEKDLLSHEQGINQAISHSAPSSPSVMVSPVSPVSPVSKRDHAELATTPAIPTTIATATSPATTHYHTERRHKRRRLPSSTSSTSSSSSTSSVPELSPSSSSSPDSDSSIYSPATPNSMQIDPTSPTKESHKQGCKHRIHLQLPTNPTTARKVIHAAAHFSTMDLLRSFPIPRMHMTASTS